MEERAGSEPSVANPVEPEDSPKSPEPQDPSAPAGQVPGAESATVQPKLERVSTRQHSRVLYTIIVVVVAIVVVMVAIAYTEAFRANSGSSTSVLLKKGTTDLIPAGQFDDVSVDAKANSTISGSVTIIYEAALYSMTYQQVLAFAKTLVVSGYLWTSGLMENVSKYSFDVPVSAGFSYFVLANPGAVESLVGYDSNLTLAPT
jgi:hypothetical protein